MKTQPPFATYVTWEELAGSPSTMEELRADLKQLPKQQVIHACSLVNVVLKTWQGNIDRDQYENLLRMVFSPEFAGRLNALARDNSPPRFVFHRQQLLFLIKEAAAYSKDSTEDLGDRFNAVFAKCCLQANDLLQHGLALDPTLPRVERLLPELVTINDYTYRESILRKLARTRIMLDDISEMSEIKAAKEYVDIQRLFSEVTGLSLREYTNLVFATLAKYLKLRLADYLENREILVFSQSYFSSTPVTSDAIDRFFWDMGISLDELRDVCSASKTRNDFTILRDRPLLALSQGRFVPSDVGFIADKLETGMFWRVHGALSSDRERENLHRFWGQLFHEYVTQLLDDICKDSPNNFIAKPHFERTGEACDGLITCGPNAVFMGEACLPQRQSIPAPRTS